jgi:hypothetical protein
MKASLALLFLCLFGCGPRSKEARECDRRINECMSNCDTRLPMSDYDESRSMGGDSRTECERTCSALCSVKD